MKEVWSEAWTGESDTQPISVLIVDYSGEGPNEVLYPREYTGPHDLADSVVVLPANGRLKSEYEGTGKQAPRLEDAPKCFVPPADSPQARALSCDADVIIFGGAAGGGKTASLVAAANRGYSNDEHWSSVTFRRTYPEVDQEGGLVDQSKRFYPDHTDYFNESKFRWDFPAGGVVNFSHMKQPDDCEDWDGAELSFIGFDQLETFERRQFFYLMGRARAPASKYNPQIFATCNPAGPSHWLYGFVQPWLGEDDYLDPEEAGEIKYFHKSGDEIRWVKQGELDEDGNRPTSVAFFPSKVDDNPRLGDSYKRWLATLDEKDKLEKRYGKWGVSRDDTLLSDHSIEIVTEDQIPSEMQRVRYWDLADSEKTPDNPNPSHTAGVRGGVITRRWTICGYGGEEGEFGDADCGFWKPGEFEGDTCPECGSQSIQTESMSILIIDHATWFRKSGQEKISRMKRMARVDGQSTYIAVEREPGSAGKERARDFKENVFEKYKVIDDHPTGDKATRASNWIPLAQTGRLWVVKGGSAMDYIECLESWDIQDVIDATSGLYQVGQEYTSHWAYV